MAQPGAGANAIYHRQVASTLNAFMYFLMTLSLFSLGAFPGFLAARYFFIAVRGILKGEVKAPIGTRSVQRYQFYHKGTFSFWVQITGYFCISLICAFMAFLSWIPLFHVK